ncbi:MAG TPA: hypothetical protein VF066_09675 [Thermoleophilaceae bacterium]
MFSELSRELLPIYLNDHLAGASVGCELARRAAQQNAGTELGDYLDFFAADAEAHRAQLEDVMARLDVKRDQFKLGAGWLAEKLGRLKLNGRLLEYSPLSRVIELEGLTLGAHGRLQLWRTLAAAAPDEPRIAEIDFVHLIEDTERQIEALEQHHLSAVQTMLAAAT